MIQVTVPTYTASVYIGFRNRSTGLVECTVEDVRLLVQCYVDKIGLCVTITETEYVYTEGGEPGCVVGLINYPRFPEERVFIRDKAFDVAKLLKASCNQLAVTVVFPDETVMFSTHPEEGAK